MPVGTGYCGVDSAELGCVSTGDLGRSETVRWISLGPLRRSSLRTCPAAANWGCKLRPACYREGPRLTACSGGATPSH